MPYNSIQDLPESVKDHLPQHGQEIYKSAFNNAWKEYNHEEERAHKVAWSAVKEKYHKNVKTGDWEEIS